MMELYRLYEEKNRNRAEYWISQGKPDYALGSLQKAHKWQQKRREIDFQVYGKYPKTRIDTLIDEHIKMVCDEYAGAFEEVLFGWRK